MSVLGELSRYIDALVAELARSADPGAAVWRRRLEAARPTGNDDLSGAATRVLAIVEEAGLAEHATAERDPRRARQTAEAADALVALCRVVLGR